MVKTTEVSKNVFLIDDDLYSIPQSGAVYFLTEGKKALIDTGPSTSTETILKGIEQIGFKPEEVDYLILTHIHLDHAGGAGTLLQSMPEAQVVAHHKAVKHLVDPSRLVQSAVDAQGKETLTRNGKMLPIDARRVSGIHDGERIELSQDQFLTLLECPGHAPHEICIFESRNHGLFVGDAVGHIVKSTDIIVPITPPPSFNLELYVQTLHRLRELEASRIYFAHFGTNDRTREKLEAAERELLYRDEIIAQAFAENKAGSAAEKVVQHVAEMLKVIRAEMPEAYNYWLSVDVSMSAIEHVRYYKNKHGLI